jgi:hypothetical protein
MNLKEISSSISEIWQKINAQGDYKYKKKEVGYRAVSVAEIATA